MSKSKYVVGFGRAGYVQKVSAIIFPEDITHRDLAECYFGSVDRIISAGFCYINDDGPGRPRMMPYGESVSLKRKSRPEDAVYLDFAMGLIEAVPFELRDKDANSIRTSVQGTA